MNKKSAPEPRLHSNRGGRGGGSLWVGIPGCPHGARPLGRQRTGRANRRRWLLSGVAMHDAAIGGAAASAPMGHIREPRWPRWATCGPATLGVQPPLGGARRENSGDAPRGPRIRLHGQPSPRG